MKLKKLFPVYLFSILLSVLSYGQEQRFSKSVAIDDLDYLFEAIKDAHFNPFAYTSEDKFEKTYRNLRNDMAKDSFNLLELISIYQRLVSSINNGHTEIDFPGSAYANYAYAGGTIFPLEIAFEKGQFLIRKNWSSQDEIRIGDKITQINGQSIEEILNKIYPQLSAERTYFKHAKIELYSFPRLYWQVFGQVDSFDIQIIRDGREMEYHFKAVDLIEGYEMKREEVINAQMELNFFEKAAYLNPGNFSGDENRYRQFVDSSFTEIKKARMNNLIIDLRNNLGGNNSFSDYLVSFIADHPFQWNSRLSIRSSKFLKEHVRRFNDTTDVYFREILNRMDGEVFDYQFVDYHPQPLEKRFDGDVYVLINRQSHSQAAVTAAQIQDYGFGVIVGEETAEYPTLYASQFQFSLPNSGVPVKVSKGQIVRVNGSMKEEGVIPDIFIKDHLLDEEDEILKELLIKLEARNASK